MQSKILILFLFTLVASSCSSKYGNGQNNSSKPLKRKQFPEVVYLIDKANNGNYEPIEIPEDIRPQPLQGKIQWIRDFYTTLKYPMIAKQNGDEGIVILNVDLGHDGKITDVFIKQSLTIECDKETIRAFISSTKAGYEPLLINGMPTKYRMEVPVGFWLE